MALIDFTLSNARRFYSSMGNPSGLKGLKLISKKHWCSHVFPSSVICMWVVSAWKWLRITMLLLSLRACSPSQIQVLWCISVYGTLPKLQILSSKCLCPVCVLGRLHLQDIIIPISGTLPLSPKSRYCRANTYTQASRKSSLGCVLLMSSAITPFHGRTS